VLLKYGFYGNEQISLHMACNQGTGAREAHFLRALFLLEEVLGHPEMRGTALSGLSSPHSPTLDIPPPPKLEVVE
jgi:hypothetical protein